MSGNAVSTLNINAQLRPVSDFDFTAEKIALIKATIMPQASDLELDLFVNFCRSKRLDPLAKQVYAIRQKNGVWQFFASIDGLRITAQRTGEYLGQTAPFWCGMDGQWRDVWLADGNPAAAKVGVFKRGNLEPTWGVATFKSYGTGKSGNWISMSDVMLAKCAEASALRKAFPDELSGVYVREEFADADRAPEPTGPRGSAALDMMAAQVGAVPINVVDAEYVDDNTGEITGQQALPDDDAVNGIEMATRGQGKRITALQNALDLSPDDLNKLAGVVANHTGPLEPRYLSKHQADGLIGSLERLAKAEDIRVTA